MSITDQSAPASIQGCLEVCRRCASLVTQLRAGADPTIYAAVGPHLRHCLDHFTALLRALPAGPVDYDARDRDPALEVEPERMLDALAATERRLAEIPAGSLPQGLEVLQLAAGGAAPHAVGSTLERELVFLSSHTIHHLALVLELAASRGFAVDRDLGVAFSTAAYREATAAAAD